MADAVLQVSPDSTGQKIDNSTLTVGSNTVLRQRFNLADPTAAAGLAAVSNANPAGTEYGLVARTIIALAPVTNGLTSSRVNAAASTNATSLKASAGCIANIDVFNAAAYSVFLKFYNKASAPTVGTDTPIWTVPIAAGTGYAKEFLRGKYCATGLAYAITKLQADSDTTVVVAGDLTGSIDWV